LESLAASILAAAAALEGSGLGMAMRGARGLYPAVNMAHLAGLVLLVGGIGVIDLRTAGFGRAIPLPTLSRLLTPLAVAGLAVMAISGFLLFCADAGPLVRSWVFQVKAALIVLALANALLFRRLYGDFEGGGEPPVPARLMAVASLGLWTTAGAMGRLIAYA
jgi:hypothetical protein